MNNQGILDGAPGGAVEIKGDDYINTFGEICCEDDDFSNPSAWYEETRSLADIREIERLKLENKAQQSYIDNALDNSKEPLISRIAELEKECSDLADDLLETENNLVSLQSKFEDIEKELKCENKILRAHLDQYEDLSYELYKTKPSESVSGIALRQLGDLNYWIEIARLNSLDHPDMGANDYYPVGTELRLPPSKGAG